MNYNYIMNSFDGSVGCEINNVELNYSNGIYKKKIPSEASQNSALKSTVTQKQQLLKVSNVGNYNSKTLNDSNNEDSKIKLSEKLKVLLKTGENKDIVDPYAFTENDLQHSGIKNKALNNVESYIGKITSSNVKLNNGILQKDMLPKINTQSIKNNSLGEKECNGEVSSSIDKNGKQIRMNSSLGISNNMGVSYLNQTASKLQLAGQLDQNKLSGLQNEKSITSNQLPLNKPLLNKIVGKIKLQNVRPLNVINSFKTNKSIGGKPFGLGHSQVFKQANNKAEKKLDSRHKNFQKGKSLLNQLQKTALLNRPSGQQIRKNSSKTSLFNVNKNIQKESSGNSVSNSFNKNFLKKSLLEESLLGLKNHKNIKDLSNENMLKLRTTDLNHSKSNYMKSQSETDNTSHLSRIRTDSLNKNKHESLERIWNIRNKLKGLERENNHFGLTINDGEFNENSSAECLLFQNYWFSVCSDNGALSNNNKKRDTKLSQLKVELRHKIKQLQWRYKDDYRDKMVELLVESARKQPNLTAFLIRLENSKFSNQKKMSRVKPYNLLKPKLCSFTDSNTGKKCEEQAMPCIKFCQQHITCSSDQLLFTSCSALQSNNTRCQAAVINQSMENPLCVLHKRLENTSEMPKNSINSRPANRPSQPRKRSRSSTSGSSRSGRSKKRKRSTHQKDKKVLSSPGLALSSDICDSPTTFNFEKLVNNNNSFKNEDLSSTINPQIVSKCDIDESQEVEVGEEVLAIAADLPLELSSQATKLLEEHDFTNVLNHIPADAFNDLFTEDKEEYEPTPQETEELERALEAIDKDVKSLEKLSQSQGILDTLLDEQTIAQTLAHLPEVTSNLEVPQTLVFYQNGFSNINQLEQNIHDVNKSLTSTMLLNQANEAASNRFNNFAIPNHTDALQS